VSAKANVNARVADTFVMVSPEVTGLSETRTPANVVHEA
jgi:hypothetical protein